MLSIHLTVPCLLLSSISGMIQTWFRLNRLGNPYPLYALSNIGSLGALLAYPTLVEPHFAVTMTLDIWNISYILLALAVLGCSIIVYRHGRETVETGISNICALSAKPTFGTLSWWCILTAMSSVCLIAYSSYLTQDVAPIPLLWVLPLSLFLLSFILCFASDRFYLRHLYLLIAPLLWIVEPFLRASIVMNTICILAIIFCFSMGCHGELVAHKPAPKHLATFYLTIAIGGAIGGIFENIIAPCIFKFYAEPVMVFCFMMLLCLSMMTRGWFTFSKSGIQFVAKPDKLRFALGAAYIVAVLIVGGEVSAIGWIQPKDTTVERFRNFYGCISIERTATEISIVHGRIIHGTQLLDPELRRQPTRYYIANGGVGFSSRIIRDSLKGHSLRCAIIGLGAGTCATYSRVNDHFTFYEINPAVERLARKYFSFLSDSPAKIDVVLGDGRLAINNKPNEKFDLIMLDVFNGDAIPVHLLTRQAFETYLHHLTPRGFLLVNISNSYVNIEPVLGNMALELHLHAYTFGNNVSTWVLMSSQDFAPEKAAYFKDPIYQGTTTPPRVTPLVVRKTASNPALGLWTDNYTNVLSLLLGTSSNGTKNDATKPSKAWERRK